MARNGASVRTSWWSCGRFGQIQVLDVLPVIAGQSLSMRMNARAMLSPLRRPMGLDARVDTFGFFVPHRWVYGDTWNKFIEEGIDESQTFATWTAPAAIESLPGIRSGGTYPLWKLKPLNMFWNRYVRDPRDPITLAEDAVPGAAAVKGMSAARVREFGLPAAHLPHITNLGNRHTAVDDNDRYYEVAVSDSAVKIDMPMLAQMRARYNSEEDRSWFNNRYADILADIWGGMAPPDADQRPRFLFYDQNWFSGREVYGTDDASLGSFVGKADMPITAGFGR